MLGIYVNGQRTVGDTAAGLAGIFCMLDIAAGMEEFDYEAFFTSYANLQKGQGYKNYLENYSKAIPTCPAFCVSTPSYN